MKRRLLIRLAVLATTLGVLFLASEAGYRLYVYGWGGLSPTAFDSVLTLTRSEILRASDDPALRFELKPDHERLYKMVVHATNAHGMRDDQIIRSLFWAGKGDGHAKPRQMQN